MCGIFGTLNFNLSKASFVHELQRMKHRGPDGMGTWQSPDGSLQLGHQRLAIIDTNTRADQPMILKNRYVIVFNGEIYNYLELKKELQKANIEFTTTSDTEVLLNLLVLKGPDALQQLNGMWAFAMYDIEEKKLFLSRDRLGEKPLYYIQQQEQFAFASEMKSLYNLLPHFNYNREFIQHTLAHPYETESLPDTLITGIKKFPAGSYATLQKGNLIFTKYYSPEKLLNQKCAFPNFMDAVEAFRELFHSSCQLRMRSDVPLGSALSGGIDSGLLVSTVAALGYQKSKSYTAVVSSFPGSALDETEDALKVANNAGVNAIAIKVNPNLNPNQILQSVYHFETIGGTSPIPFYQTYQGFRNNNIIVTLDGHGGDELFGGYSFDMYEKLKDDFPNLYQMRNTLSTIDKMYGFNNEITLKKTMPYFKGELLKRIKQKSIPAIFEKEQYYKRKLYHSTFLGILPTLLRNYDCYSMYAGVEIRMPYLDYRIVEFAFSLPNNFKVRNGFSKALLRNAAKDIMPKNVLHNKVKYGWNSPMGEWFSGIWKEWLLDELNSTAFANYDLTDTTRLKNMVTQFYSQSKNEQGAGQAIWLQLQPYLIQRANDQFSK